MEITALNEDGTVFQEPIYDITYEEVRNEYKPAEMSEAIRSSLSPTEELVITNIRYTDTQASNLDISTYVKDYNNIRRIVWSCSSSYSIAIYDHDIYLKNLKAGVVNPHRIMFYSDNSTYMPMDTLTSGLPSSTRYYYFSDSAWNASGQLQVLFDTDGDGTSNAGTSYDRYGKSIYLVYKKEDTE